mgnify:CR=1 FL=1
MTLPRLQEELRLPHMVLKDCKGGPFMPGNVQIPAGDYEAVALTPRAGQQCCSCSHARLDFSAKHRVEASMSPSLTRSTSHQHPECSSYLSLCADATGINFDLMLLCKAMHSGLLPRDVLPWAVMKRLEKLTPDELAPRLVTTVAVARDLWMFMRLRTPTPQLKLGHSV